MNAKSREKNDDAGVVRQGNYPAWLELVYEQVRSVKFGVVQITIHDSRVVQIERSEKFRLDRPEI